MNIDTKGLIVGGVYQHYSGKLYKILHIALSSNDAYELEPTVVYQALYHDPKLGDQVIWVRSLAEFTKPYLRDGRECQRYSLVTNVHTSSENIQEHIK